MGQATSLRPKDLNARPVGRSASTIRVIVEWARHGTAFSAFLTFHGFSRRAQ
jgi:hypothetical protein